MYLWQIEYNSKQILFFLKMLWIALNFVSLTDWIQRFKAYNSDATVVNRFKFCIFDRLNTTSLTEILCLTELWIALNYVSLTDWIQRSNLEIAWFPVVNRFKLCIFDRLNTTFFLMKKVLSLLWIALNYVSLTDWIQQNNSWN